MVIDDIDERGSGGPDVIYDYDPRERTFGAEFEAYDAAADLTAEDRAERAYRLGLEDGRRMLAAEACPTCKGTGTVVGEDSDGWMKTLVCPTCKGSGQVG